MRKSLFFIVFALFVQLLYGQEKYIIQGEFPDNSLDGKYIILTDKSFLPDEYKRKWKASDDEVKILVTDKKFYYEGTTTRKPFLAQIYYDRSTFSGQTSATSFVIEPGNIHIHITDWYEEGNVSGTLINKDYNTCVIERRNLVNRIFRTIRLKGQTSEAEGTYSFGSAFEDFEKGELAFFEKYAKYPDVVRVMLSRYLEVKELNKRLVDAKYLRILDLMPKADRDILIAWREYTMKKEEYWAKRRALTDSLNRNAPRFIERQINNN